MTPAEAIALIQAAQAAGITSIKFGDLECTFAGATEPTKPAIVLVPPEDETIRHKIEEVKSVMQLGDLELMDRMFPAPTEDPIEELKA